MTTRAEFPPETDEQPNLPAVPEDENDEMVQKALAYRTLSTTPQRLQRSLTVLNKNLAGQKIGIFDLPRVTSEGDAVWSLPTANADHDFQKSIEGIIVHIEFPRAYWENQINEGRTPPNCSSPDGLKGFGLPGGDCESCEFNKWGTSKTGNRTGKACREQNLLFLLRPGNLFPLVVQVPPTSIDAVKQYCFALSDEDRLYSEVFTTLSLLKVEDGANKYNKIIITKSGDVPERFTPALEHFTESFIPLLNRSYRHDTQDQEPNPAVAKTEADLEQEGIIEGSATHLDDPDGNHTDQPETPADRFEEAQESLFPDEGSNPANEQAPDLPF